MRVTDWNTGKMTDWPMPEDKCTGDCEQCQHQNECAVESEKEND